MTQAIIYRISALGRGSLSIMAKPDSSDLPATFESIKSSGTTLLVSLLENAEAKTVGLAAEANWCKRYQMDFLHFPIPDFSTPTHPEEFTQFTHRVHTQIQQGAQAVIHCRGGIGRAGMTACTVLVQAGFAADESIAMVSKSRGKTVPETQDQIALIRQIEAHRQ